jgi:CubicO group peptidase (beta-lactamase class C family)
MKKLNLVCLILLVLGCSNCSKKAIKSVEDLDTSFKDLSKDMLFAGFAVTIVNKDKVLYQNAFGQADVAKNTPYTNQTLQPIASISKTFIGVAVTKAVEQGFFTLETPINDILPFKIKNPYLPNSIIRIKHLTNHTSGIVDNEKIYFKNHTILSGESTNSVEAKRMQSELGFGTSGTVLSLKDFFQGYCSEGGSLYEAANFISAEPGTTYNYSNVASALAAYVIEAKTGKSFPEFCAENIFKPLGMANTSWVITPANRPKMAILHWERAKPIPYYMAATYPDGELITSNEDLSKFFVEMIKGFSGESTFMKKESFETMFKKQATIPPPTTDKVAKEDAVGTFWVYFKNGRIGHTGGDLGVTTLMAFYPDSKKGFIFMANSEYENLPNTDAINAQFQKIVTDIKSFEENN